jgi:hypothetical protein
MKMRKTLFALTLSGFLLGGSMTSALAAPLPDNCTKTQGTVTCTTFEGPGRNQGGVGSTETNETQGNTKNVSPEPQDLEDECTVSPPKSQGAPDSCP